MQLKVTQTLKQVAVISLVLIAGAMSAEAQSGVVEKVWVEYGVKVKGETGIRIHAKFTVKNALNISCSILARAERADGQSFSFTSNNFTTQNGKRVQITTYNTYATKDGKAILILKPFTPPYDSADYPDTTLFFPYWAVRLRPDSQNKMKLVVTLSANGKEFAKSAVVDIGLAVGKAP